MYLPPAKVEKAIKTQATVIVDTSIFFDYLQSLSCFSEDTDKNKQFEFRALKKIIPQFYKRIITPQVLSEVCNLANTKFNEQGRKEFLTSILKQLLITEEKEITNKAVLGHEHFCLLGATDISCILTSKDSDFQRYLLIEDDVAKNIAADEGITPIDKGELIGYYVSTGGT